MKRRVVVTGIGIISPIGHNKDTYHKNLVNGNSSFKISSIPNLNDDSEPAIVSEAGDLDSTEIVPKSHLRRIDRSTFLALAAVKEAIDDSGLAQKQISSKKLGLFTGISVGGLTFASEQLAKVLEGGLAKISPFLAIAEFPSSCLGELSIFFKIKGKGSSVSTAFNSSLDAIGLAFNEIQNGYLDCAIAGGTESPLVGIFHSSLTKMGLLSLNFLQPNKASKPFDKERDGFLLAEGACFLVLEALEVAKARNKQMYSEIVDYDSSFDPDYVVNGSKESSSRPIAEKTLSKLIRKNAFYPDYISASAASEKHIDSTELEMFKKVFQNEEIVSLKRIINKKGPIQLGAIKSIIGHTIGASGSFEVASSCLALKHKVVPPIKNLENPEPDCQFFKVSNKKTRAHHKHILVSGLDFLGNNSFLLLQGIA